MTGTLGPYARADISGTDGTHSYRNVQCPGQWKYSRYPREYDQNRIGISYNPDTPLFGIFHSTALSPVRFKRWDRNMRQLYPNILSRLRRTLKNHFFMTPYNRGDFNVCKR